jgi:hypothetical protein
MVSLRIFLAALLRPLALFAVLALMPGCAAFTKVLRTVDDIADAACAIFGKEHPAEFIELVKHAKPDLAPKLDRASLDVGALCDFKEIVQPFIEDQLSVQRSAVSRARAASSGGESDAAAPQ